MSKDKRIESSMLTFFVQEMNQNFWEQTQTTELDSQEFLIEHEFVREARKEVKVKHTLLVLGEEYLYKISPKQNLKRVPLNILHFDTIPKLPEDHILQLNSENELQGFKLTYANKILQVFTSNSVVFLQWQAILRRKCLLSSFHEKYHVEKIIGKGSFAKVYLATSNGQSYAIKAFSKQFINEQQKGKESLLNEMQVMRAIKHPNIVQLLEVHETQNSIYFVLELVVGGELLQRVKEKGLLKSDDLIKIAFNLLSALDHLHQKKIFHRDLKPENLLFKSKDDNYNIMIADFGLAAFSDQELIFKRCGTPGFVAPEILLYIDGGPIYDTKCDIFSAGVILYILITGKQPFPGQDQKAILKANKACQIDFGLPAFLKTPIEFQDLVKKMLSSKINDRPSAQDCLKHKLFAKISQQLKQDQQDFEEQQQQVLNNLANYDIEYTIGLKNNTQNSEDQVGSQQLQWRKPAYNGNVQTVETLTNCSTVSIKQIDAQSTSQSQQQKQPQQSKFSIFSAKLSRQNSFDGGTDMFKDCASPGRSKISKEKDLHKIALKNSFRFYQKPQIQVEDNQINQEKSEVSELIKRHNSSELIKMNRTDHDIQSPKKVE
ncbi:unnamed protein product [Paramecium pentaurelia]|uniref:non-specific serine/threonine protein kinase n=1 Tax=Paramecium pentaurelia TaxID=43138 RepID=A0A8S1VWL3_9CILI|nr:unnamed protein product [Paramecium pentaurelia]